MGEQVEKYFLIYNRRLVKGFSTSKDFFLADEAFEYINGQWKSLDRNQINDRLMGYDPTEVDFYAIGNTDIMKEINEISAEKINKYMK